MEERSVPGRGEGAEEDVEGALVALPPAPDHGPRGRVPSRPPPHLPRFLPRDWAVADVHLLAGGLEGIHSPWSAHSYGQSLLQAGQLLRLLLLPPRHRPPGGSAEKLPQWVNFYTFWLVIRG